MLWLVILYPVVTIATDLPIETVIMVLYPAFLALLPVVVYCLSKQLLDLPGAALAALLSAFITPFYTALVHNTRTGAAIFYFALLVLYFVQDSRESKSFRLLGVLFVFGLITTHYGVAPIAILILGVATVLYLAGVRLWPDLSKSEFTPPYGLYLVFGILLIVWYQRTASGFIFEFATRITFGRYLTGLSLFDPGSDTAEAVFTTTQSRTSFIRQIQSIGWLLIAGIGYCAIAIRRTERVPLYHLAVTAGVFLYLTITLAATSIGADRIYSLATVFLAPYAIWALLRFFDGMSVTAQRAARGAVAVCLIVSLVFNAGVVAFALNEKSPQPELNQHQITESGDTERLFILSRRHLSDAEVASVGWLLSHKSDGEIYGPGPYRRFASYHHVTEYDPIQPPGQYNVIKSANPPAGSYIFVNEFAVRTGLLSTGKYGAPTKSIHVDRVVSQSRHAKVHDSGAAWTIQNQTGVEGRS
jgi:uncharacterized membrane protein